MVDDRIDHRNEQPKKCVNKSSVDELSGSAQKVGQCDLHLIQNGTNKRQA